jgi:hypothetical protein
MASLEVVTDQEFQVSPLLLTGRARLLDLLIRGSQKVIRHYRLLLASAKTEHERELYKSRIEREQRLLDELHAASQTGSRRDMSDRGYSFASFDIELKRRGRGRWKWSVCTRDGRAVMCGSECSRSGALQGGERAVFPVVRQCLMASQVAARAVRSFVARRSGNLPGARPQL